MGWNKIELSGRVTCKPELRAAPDDRWLLSFPVDCGGANQRLEPEILMIGETGRAPKSKLEPGLSVKVSGGLRATQRSSRNGLSEVRLSVIASAVTLGRAACIAEGRAQTEPSDAISASGWSDKKL